MREKKDACATRYQLRSCSRLFVAMHSTVLGAYSTPQPPSCTLLARARAAAPLSPFKNKTRDDHTRCPSLVPFRSVPFRSIPFHLRSVTSLSHLSARFRSYPASRLLPPSLFPQPYLSSFHFCLLTAASTVFALIFAFSLIPTPASSSLITLHSPLPSLSSARLWVANLLPPNPCNLYQHRPILTPPPPECLATNATKSSPPHQRCSILPPPSSSAPNLHTPQSPPFPIPTLTDIPSSPSPTSSRYPRTWYQTLHPLVPLRPYWMDRDHRLLPRFADIQSHSSDPNPQDDDSTHSERRYPTLRHSNLPELNPAVLHPPMQPHHTARADALYQSVSRPLTHPPVQSQPFYLHRIEINNSPPPSSLSQPIPVLSTLDPDRVVRSQSPSTDTPAHTMSTAQLSSHPRHHSTPVAEGSVTKPKKLHREVEQKRRMRMAEQIVELRKWVSNPNGGKTDKVSVLQDAVSYVKDASRKIDELQDALHRSRDECAHLRTLLSKAQPAFLPAPSAHLVSHLARPAPVQHPVGSLRHPAEARVEQVQHPSRFAIAPPNFDDRALRTTLPDDASHGVLARPLPVTHYSSAATQSRVGRVGPSSLSEPTSIPFGHGTNTDQAISVGIIPDYGNTVPYHSKQGEQMLVPQVSESSKLQPKPPTTKESHYRLKQNPAGLPTSASGQAVTTTQREQSRGGSLSRICDSDGKPQETEGSDSRSWNFCKGKNQGIMRFQSLLIWYSRD